MSLFAALDVKTGMVIGECRRKHRHQEFIRLLNTVDEVLCASAVVLRALHADRYELAQAG